MGIVENRDLIEAIAVAVREQPCGQKHNQGIRPIKRIMVQTLRQIRL